MAPTRPGPTMLPLRKALDTLLGGLHLTGGLFEARIEPTVEALRAARVGRILPAHCSGWRAVHAIARAMPEAFVQSAVGTTVTFEAAQENSS